MKAKPLSIIRTKFVLKNEHHLTSKRLGFPSELQITIDPNVILEEILDQDHVQFDPLLSKH